MNLISLKDITKKYGCTLIAARNRIRRRCIQPAQIIPASQSKGREYLYNAEDIEKAFNTAVIPKIKDFWKLSVFNFELEHFIVKACCLTKKEAAELLKELQILGEVGRISPHVSKEATK